MDEFAVWVDLARRLKAADPVRYRKALELFRGIVTTQEVLARQEHTLLLRPKRTLKKYSA